MHAPTIRWLGCITLGLMLVLLLVRAQVLDIDYGVVFRYPRAFYIVLLGSYYDLLLAAGLGAAFMGLAVLFRRSPRAQKLLIGAFLGLALVAVWAAVSYITTSTLLGGPMTYGWLYYSDFMQNSDFYSALRANVSWALAGQLLGWSAALLLSSYLLWALLRRLDPEGRRFGLLAAVPALGLLAFFILAPRYIHRNNLTYKLTANPVLAFSHSVYAALASPPDLFTLQVPAGFEAFPTPTAAGGRSTAPASPRIRNVLLFVLESTPAEYVPGYQTRINAMPELARRLPQALRVADMYAHMPSTNNAVVALLGSLYPKISYQSITKEHPDIRTPSLSSELRRHKFRTGFFFAADTRFQNMDGFLARRGFDTLADFRTIPCTKPVQEIDPEETDFLSSSDESCLIRACTQWLPADSAQAPFFATVWTAQTHYPYFPPAGPEHDYQVPEQYLNRYLNALHYSDQQLGRLLAELDKRRLTESTLVVVVGDHGEAFGRHVQYGHASNIYEENVRIPLLLINPLLFHGETLPVIGGQVDVAPSILDILRLPIPAQWQGTSLFNPNRQNRAYFFSPYSHYLFGYRDGRHKVIFNASTSQTQVYDLQMDPQESNNLAGQLPDYAHEGKLRLARWVQYQNAYLPRLLQPEPGGTLAPAAAPTGSARKQGKSE
ncbi:hypothetical protein GCM10023185_41570 [Hymenobacter saemangeumensis]|uniref:Sulfatase N-terminal domain-containing protein n=1 Tax=Hymenobacter saemangeumensis TaxID=1084522 RepID=A0ABP8IRE0_9BACT